MNTDLRSRDAAVCWHPYTQHALDREPLEVAAAEGAWLELADGRHLLDALSSWWTCLHGHGQPELVEAARAQAARLDHVLFAGCTHEPAVALAERLTALAPEGLSRVFYSDDGSTAVEVALKAAYQSWVRRGEPSRTIFIALEGGYHGDTFGAMAVGDPDPFFTEFAPFLFHVVRVKPSADGLEHALCGQAGRVAGVLIEPMVQGAAGMRFHDARFLQEARRLCDEHGTWLIADEVMTGFGRTGRTFACEHAGIAPDLMCLSKGLTGGMLPLAATLVREEIFAEFLSDDRARSFFHGHSFTAHPIGCAVALASLDLLQANAVPERLQRIGTRIAEEIEPLRGRRGIAGLRQLGGIVAVELATDDAGYLSERGRRIRAACRRQDVLLRPLGNVLYAIPPACLNDEECALVGRAMVEVVDATMRDASPGTTSSS